ncbi:hypothetical protein CK203_077102 [Vitis vinifera]|uniref:Uncharacterized protein n=1 Tax=Vitis vinifera TaxID=29760 RepID=A0A438D5U7_VITVI|nr:hypothetical protein CK203_077102 [Vitis vinifera]
MGTREVYEQKLRSGNLHHDPTINPGLGSPRCPRCLSLINPNSKSGEWTITSVLHDATAVAGAGIGGMLSAVYGINTGIPYIQNRVRGPKWLPFIIGMPPLLMFSATCAAFGGKYGQEKGRWYAKEMKEGYKVRVWKAIGGRWEVFKDKIGFKVRSGHSCERLWEDFAPWCALSLLKLWVWEHGEVLEGQVVNEAVALLGIRGESQFVNDSNFSRAVFIGYALPKFAQLTVTSYYAASSASHYGISLLTRHIEEVHTAQSHREKLR